MRTIAVLLVSATLISTADAVPPQPAPPTPAVPAPKDVPYPGTITLAVDASNMAQNIVTVHETIPVPSGVRLTLLYPEWRPGNHSPTARTRIGRVAGLMISANGAPIAWARDPVNVYAFYVPVPPKATSVTVDFQYLSPPSGEFGRQESTTTLLTLDWDAVVLYPAGYYARQIPIEPSLKVPAGWRSRPHWKRPPSAMAQRISRSRRSRL